MLRQILAVLLLAAATTLPCVQAATAASAPSSVASQANIGDPLAQQVELLKAQLETTRAYHSSLLDTVYWALGTVVVMVTLLVGFGWFANFRVYERDKDVLRRELDAQNQENRKQLEAFLERRLEPLKSEVEAELAQRLESLEAINTVLSRRLNAHLASLERDQIRESIQSSLSASYSLDSALRLLENCIDQATEEVPDVLHLMLKKMDDGGRFTAKAITDVNAALDRLPNQYKTLCDKLRAKLIASDIY